jgi:hypothetical protein
MFSSRKHYFAKASFRKKTLIMTTRFEIGVVWGESGSVSLAADWQKPSDIAARPAF